MEPKVQQKNSKTRLLSSVFVLTVLLLGLCLVFPVQVLGALLKYGPKSTQELCARRLLTHGKPALKYLYPYFFARSTESYWELNVPGHFEYFGREEWFDDYLVEYQKTPNHLCAYNQLLGLSLDEQKYSKLNRTIWKLLKAGQLIELKSFDVFGFAEELSSQDSATILELFTIEGLREDPQFQQLLVDISFALFARIFPEIECQRGQGGGFLGPVDDVKYWSGDKLELDSEPYYRRLYKQDAANQDLQLWLANPDVQLALIEFIQCHQTDSFSDYRRDLLTLLIESRTSGCLKIIEALFRDIEKLALVDRYFVGSIVCRKVLERRQINDWRKSFGLSEVVNDFDSKLRAQNISAIECLIELLSHADLWESEAQSTIAFLLSQCQLSVEQIQQLQKNEYLALALQESSGDLNEDDEIEQRQRILVAGTFAEKWLEFRSVALTKGLLTLSTEQKAAEESFLYSMAVIACRKSGWPATYPIHYLNELSATQLGRLGAAVLEGTDGDVTSVENLENLRHYLQTNRSLCQLEFRVESILKLSRNPIDDPLQFKAINSFVSQTLEPDSQPLYSKQDCLDTLFGFGDYQQAQFRDARELVKIENFVVSCELTTEDELEFYVRYLDLLNEEFPHLRCRELDQPHPFFAKLMKLLNHCENLNSFHQRVLDDLTATLSKAQAEELTMMRKKFKTR